ncbi:hypothetical protein HZB58_06000 [Candidatus Gottesmanbacteria bacterium]|nr:hypothetical protein [Candidatus Gottesmanbacteria bacterium]
MTKRTPPIETSPPATAAPEEKGLFPHYTRLFSASRFSPVIKLGGRLLLWIVLIAGIGINIAALHRNPENVPAWTTFVSRAADVLGTTDSTNTDSGSNTKTNEAEYSFWIEVINSHPDYRDAHVNAAILAFKLGLLNEARSHTNKVKELDPNYPGVMQLEDLLSKN